MDTVSKGKSSAYKGVSRHRTTGRYEAHFWDRYSASRTRARGKQVYIGGFCSEEEAARMYDRAAIAFLGPNAPELQLNFKVEDYVEELSLLTQGTIEERIGRLRRKSVGFSRGASKYRGVTRHHSQGRWEARLGRMGHCRYNWLGVYDTEEEAARAYDWAVVSLRGKKALTNFDISHYPDALQKYEEDKAKKGKRRGASGASKKKQKESPPKATSLPLVGLAELLGPESFQIEPGMSHLIEIESNNQPSAGSMYRSEHLHSIDESQGPLLVLDFDGNANISGEGGTDALCALLSKEIADLLNHI